MIAIKLFENGAITLTHAAKLANLSVSGFLQKLATLGIVVVDQSSDELESDLKALE